MSNESKGRTRVGAVGRRRSAPKSQLELRLWGRSEDASKAFVAEFGETMCETLASAGLKGVRFRAEGHEDLAYLALPFVVLEVPDVASVVEALNSSDEDDLEAEVIEVEGYKCTTLGLAVYSDGLPDEDSEDAHATTSGDENAAGAVPADDEEQPAPLRIAQTKTFTLVIVERPEEEGVDWDPTDFTSSVAFAADDIFRYNALCAKVQPVARTALLFVRFLDRVAPDLRRHPRAEELLVQMHDHAGELLLKIGELSEEIKRFHQRRSSSLFLRHLAGTDDESVDEIELTLVNSERRLKQVTHFTKGQIESRGLRADLGLNQSMLWLTVITLAFGLLTLFDKYQSDRTFGLDAWTGLLRMLSIGILLAAFSVLSFRRQIGERLQSASFWNWLQGKTLSFGVRPPDRSKGPAPLWRWPLDRIREFWRDVQFEGAWWVSLESLQRIHTQLAPLGEQLDWTGEVATEPGDRLKEARERRALDERVLEEIVNLDLSLTRLELSFDQAERRRAFGPHERLRQVEAMVRYLMRVSSLVLEWERPLLPNDEVAYWLVAKQHIIKVGNIAGDDFDLQERLSDMMPPWSHALGLASLTMQRFLAPVSEVDWLAERLDAAAKRLLDKYAVEPVEREGALERLFNPDDHVERGEYWERYDLDSWYAAAAEEGLTYDNLSQRWAEAQRREDEAEARG